MAITRIANDIIVLAYRMVGLQSPNTEMEGWKTNEGLRLLNFLLDDLSSVAANLPITDTLEFNLVAGQYKYTLGRNGEDIDFDPITLIKTSFILQNEIVYRLKSVNFSMFFAGGRTFSTRGKPAEILLEKKIDQSILSFYPVPDIAYSVRVEAKKHLDLLESQDILDELPVYYHRFLKYALARELAGINNRTWSPTFESEYLRMFNQIRANAVQDSQVERDVHFENRGNLIRGNRCVRTY